MSRPSDPSKVTVWWERFERFSSSGLTVGQFCSRERVSVASFYHWRKKLASKGRRRLATERHPRLRADPAAGRGRFQQVAVVSGTSRVLPPASAVCIQLPCGTRIEVGAGDLDVVRTVVAAVARADRGDEVRMASC